MLNNNLEVKKHIVENINIFKKQNIINLIENLDSEIIKVLITNKTCKDYFFIQVNDTYIFNQKKLIDYLASEFGHLFAFDNATLSYANRNKILISDMNKEDDKYGNEIFYDPIEDKEHLTNLFKPKVLSNIRKYNKKQKEFSDILSEDNNNLLIKGNNLIGLYSLSKKFSNSIDMIYIDPPYYFNKNKAADSFEYNSNFKLSTWLTFMKNRLDVAKEILSRNGVIFISMSEDGTSHLKVLCDEVFGKENFITNFVWRNTGQQQNNGKNVVTVTESILCYSKQNNGKNINKVSIEDRKGIKSYRYVETEGENIGKLFRANPIQDHTLGKHKITIEHKLTKEILTITSRVKEEDLWKLDKEGLIYWGDGSKSTLPQKKKYLHDNKGVLVSNIIEGIYYEQSNKELFDLFGIKNLFSYSKPVDLIRFLVEIGSKKDSIVMDFFCGSGSTGHAVMKQNKIDNGNRKFILLEQMDYIENITEERLKRAIEKEDYNESFIYMEMLESAEKFIKTELKLINDKHILIDFINLNDIENKDIFINFIHNNDIKTSIRFMIKQLSYHDDYCNIDEIEEYIGSIKKENFYNESKEILFNKKFYDIT